MTSDTSNILWQPSPAQQQSSAMAKFSAHLAQKLHRPELNDYAELHRFSVSEQPLFWREFMAFSGIKGASFDIAGLEIVEPVHQSRYFADATLNLAENLLCRDDDGDAIIFRAENQVETRLSWKALCDAVSLMQQALKDNGLEIGDRVCAVTPNCPEAVIAMLATQSLGGVWSSCSPDFGVQGILERFAQITPKFLFCTDGYWYNGKLINICDKITNIMQAIPSLEQTIIAPLIHKPENLLAVPNTVLWQDFTAPFSPQPCQFTPLPFDHPAFILFSSGTTGKPKCFIHGLGAYLCTNRLDLMLHNDVRYDDRTMFFTTCGWMMWNWLVGALGIGSSIVLYDGSPFADGAETLFRLADSERITLLGLSPKFLSVVEKTPFSPKTLSNFTDLRRISTSGSPLSKGNFAFVYQHIKADVHLCPISGGTDILGCFLGGEPRQAVHSGEMQVPLLGKDVVAMDDNASVLTLGTGELICQVPFLGMPLGFWDDDNQQKYHDAYFNRFANIWCHGDFLERTESGYIIHGRSDTVLNPSGVRIGTAEIYQAIEHLPELADAVVIGQQWDNDIRIVLFVVLAADANLNENLRQSIRSNIKNTCSPRHLPAKILTTPAIPRTRSGKISEKAVSDVVHHRPVHNQEALDNPESLAYFTHRSELAE